MSDTTPEFVPDLGNWQHIRTPEVEGGPPSIRVCGGPDNLWFVLTANGRRLDRFRGEDDWTACTALDCYREREEEREAREP